MVISFYAIFQFFLYVTAQHGVHVCTPMDAPICRHLNCERGLLSDDPWCTDTYTSARQTYNWFWNQPYNRSDLVTYFAHCSYHCSEGYINETSCDGHCISQLQQVLKASETMWLGEDYNGYMDWKVGIQSAILYHSLQDLVVDTNSKLNVLLTDRKNEDALY